jgi:hypothetical protein
VRAPKARLAKAAQSVRSMSSQTAPSCAARGSQPVRIQLRSLELRMCLDLVWFGDTAKAAVFRTSLDKGAIVAGVSARRTVPAQCATLKRSRQAPVHSQSLPEKVDSVFGANCPLTSTLASAWTPHPSHRWKAADLSHTTPLGVRTVASSSCRFSVQSKGENEARAPLENSVGAPTTPTSRIADTS